MADLSPRAVHRLILSTWDRLHESFWFIPSIFVMGSVGLAVTLIAVDLSAPRAIAERLPFVHVGSPDGARTVLSVLAGAMITVTSLTFSLTIVALTLASQQYGPRLLRSFTRDRTTQAALGIFVATFAYCLVVLQAVRDRDNTTFVPGLSVSTGLVLALFSLAVLVYFIHHVASSIQASTLLRTVAAEVDDALSRQFPREVGAGGTSEHWTPGSPDEAMGVQSPADGYVQIVDGQALVALAERADLRIVLLCQPGMFLQEGETTMRVWPSDRGSRHSDALARTIVTGERRTLIQDASFAIEQFVEMAVRALSPGVNDPFTALACLEHLGAALRRVGERPTPQAVRLDGHGEPRVLTRPVTFERLAHVAFDEIRRAAEGNTLVLERLLDVCGRLLAAVQRERDRAALLAIASAAIGDARRSVACAEDRETIELAYAACVRSASPPTTTGTTSASLMQDAKWRH